MLFNPYSLAWEHYWLLFWIQVCQKSSKSDYWWNRFGTLQSLQKHYWFTSYFGEILLAFFIGIFSPNGFLVFTSSSAASSILGALGLLFLLKFIDNATNSFAERLVINQNWWWVMAGFTFCSSLRLAIAPGVHQNEIE